TAATPDPAGPSRRSSGWAPGSRSGRALLRHLIVDGSLFGALRLGGLFDRDSGGYLLGLCALGPDGVEIDLALRCGDLGGVGAVRRRNVGRRLGVEGLSSFGDAGDTLRSDALRFRLEEVGPDLESRLVLRLDRLDVLRVVERELLVRRQAAVPGARKGLVGAALAVRED